MDSGTVLVLGAIEAAAVLLVVGLRLESLPWVLALWSTSAYVAGLIRRPNKGYIWDCLKTAGETILILEKELRILKGELLSAAEKEERERLLVAARADREKVLAELTRFPTSSTNLIMGKKIIRQIRMISVDNHSHQQTAEIEFIAQVERAGGNAVINMVIRRHQGGLVSVQGDAVLVE